MSGFVSAERLAYGPWAAFERMLARLLEHAGFRDVYIVGGAGDLGADIVATFNGVGWVVQAKFRDSVGVDSSAAREAVRALSEYEAKIAVAAASTNFTEDAYKYFNETKLSGIELRLWPGKHLLEYYNQLPTYSKARRELRKYQSRAVDEVESHRGKGRDTALVIMATGLGKSIVANEIIANELERNGDQEILVLAHTTPLVQQLEQSSWSQLAKQHSTHLWCDGELPSYSGGVVFATWQSLLAARNRGEDLARRYGLVIVDEAHHAPSQSYRLVIDDIQPNMLVGLTATPWRGDDQNIEEIFGEPVFTMDIVEGMQAGYLADVDYRMLTDGINWDAIAAQSTSGLTVKDLNQYLILPDRDNAMVKLVVEKMDSIDSPRALVFCRSIEHAKRLKPLFTTYGKRAALLHGKLSRVEKFTNLSSFRKGDIDLLISVEMLNEGIDVPEVNIVSFMRVTHSRRIFIQQLGRGLRLSDNKDKVLVLDFVADIRRLAAGRNLNNRAREISADGSREVIRFEDGQVVKFDNDKALSFFDEYLADISDLENLDETTRLQFPDRTTSP